MRDGTNIIRYRQTNFATMDSVLVQGVSNLLSGENLTDNPQINPESPFGKMQQSQGEKNLINRPHSTGNRYACEFCEQLFMSDESLQLHKLCHIVAGLLEAVDRLRAEGVPVRLVK